MRRWQRTTTNFCFLGAVLVTVKMIECQRACTVRQRRREEHRRRAEGGGTARTPYVTSEVERKREPKTAGERGKSQRSTHVNNVQVDLGGGSQNATLFARGRGMVKQLSCRRHER
ncbi:hypothetical protein EXIGLDRAFT_476231 [Exidia glandulosa HHB12029]|uniref:Secreted protein n=1 Tax=Exidia glandulosa HHB12029 TaxID=1314781 RepID=A0A166NKF1_EXIGL|nr:hypothetical protein EXIGLDRAFT_476231 [Exidia glandulosa HHB12029]